jgi:hydrogenase maturation factor
MTTGAVLDAPAPPPTTDAARLAFATDSYVVRPLFLPGGDIGTLAVASVQAGDRILLSGDIGRHGIAILATREGLGFETRIESDCAPVAAPVRDLVRRGVALHCLRGRAASADLLAVTRGAAGREAR